MWLKKYYILGMSSIVSITRNVWCFQHTRVIGLPLIIRSQLWFGCWPWVWEHESNCFRRWHWKKWNVYNRFKVVNDECSVSAKCWELFKLMVMGAIDGKSEHKGQPKYCKERLACQKGINTSHLNSHYRKCII